jgi:hypothetical protein
MSETLPELKDAREWVIAEKFVAILRRTEQRELNQLERLDPDRPDFLAREGSRAIELELIEITEPRTERKRATQQSFAQGISELVRDLFPHWDGLEIQLHDGYQSVPYPPVRSRQGKRLVEFIAQCLRSAATNFEVMAPGHQQIYEWQNAPGQVTVAALVTRVSPSGSGRPVTLRYSGTFPTTVDEVQSRLSRTVGKKLSKHYARDPSRSYWLLAYELGFPSVWTTRGRAVDLARELLGAEDHPFDEVWYFYPLPEAGDGFLTRVRP